MADDQTQPVAAPVADPSAAPQARPNPAPAQGQDAPEDPAKAQKRGAQRRGLFLLLGGVLAVAGIGFFLYWLLVGSHYVSTDNAYVGADLAQVTPLVSGAVIQVRVADTQPVKRGDVLVVIDPADAQVAAERAQAQYDQAVRQVRQDFATGDQLEAQVAARDADLARAAAQLASAQSDLAKTKVDLDRREALAASGAVSGEELTSAKNAYQTAVANLAATKAAGAQAVANKKAAEAQLQAQQALTKGVSAENNPAAQAAKAALDQAKLDLSRTVIAAPIDGVVTKRQVQVGQRVAVGAPLMTIAPLGAVYVDANFKETQLRKVRIGQPVTLKSDKYGGHVEFHGRVAGVGGGTGSAFAVIPAQNATGNWIKVVQRLPVRIELDAQELRAHPLEVGLSVDAKINVANPGDDQPRDRDQAPAASRQDLKP
jgi:membrane fusion protein (multidrug efflux system)